MTAIKPPSGPSGTLPHTGVDICAVGGGGTAEVTGEVGAAGATGPLAGAEGAVGVTEAEAQRVGQGVAAGVPGHSPLAAAEHAGGPVASAPASLVELARAVERGQLSMAQAVDRLVESTVGSLPGKLTELERAELSELLRQALATDPTLSALRNEQGG